MKNWEKWVVNISIIILGIFFLNKIIDFENLIQFGLKKNVKRPTLNEYTNNYISISYSHQGRLVITGFYDSEIIDNVSKTWMGTDLSYKIDSETQISLFYGSQKGGLVCANGICAEQPGFADGIKITFRSLF